MAASRTPQTVKIFRGTMRHVAGALDNQRSYLRGFLTHSLVVEPVGEQTIQNLHAARHQQVPYVEISVPDAIHAIEGLRCIAHSYSESAVSKRDVPGLAAEHNAKAYRALAGMMVKDVIDVYELSPDTQYELLSPLEMSVER